MLEIIFECTDSVIGESRNLLIIFFLIIAFCVFLSVVFAVIYLSFYFCYSMVYRIVLMIKLDRKSVLEYLAYKRDDKKKQNELRKSILKGGGK